MPLGAIDDEARLGVGLDGAAHGLERAHGADAILAGQEAGDDGRAVGQRGEKDGAMREAFVAGDADFAAEAAGLADGEGGCGQAAHLCLTESMCLIIGNEHFAQL